MTLLDASQLATAIHERQVSSEQAVEAYLYRINEHNSKLNAIITLDAESARKRAKAADAAHGTRYAHLDKRFNGQGVPASVSGAPSRPAA